MPKRTKAQIIQDAQKAVTKEMNGHSGSFYARGLASEGYSGGYYDALCDVLLILNGVMPNRRNYWVEPPPPEPQPKKAKRK